MLHTVWIGPDPAKLHMVWHSDDYINIPMAQFNRLDSQGKKICRWFLCNNYHQKPWRHYCSEECHDKFESWYWRTYWTFFSWQQVKADVWKRDGGICQMCNKQLLDNANPWTDVSPEYDHIIEKHTAMKELGYDKRPFWFYLREILYNRSNVRLVCHPCHRKITGEFNSKRWEKIRKVRAATPKPMQEQLLKYLAAD